MRFRGQYAIDARKKEIEPVSVNWQNFGVEQKNVTVRFAVGICVVIVAILLWGGCFYAPYAYYESWTFMALGKPPTFLAEFTFTMLVVIGNQIMYFLCQVIAQRVGFRFEDDQQAAYVVLYTAACLVNMIVDVCIVVCTTYLSMIAQRVRTDDGILLADLPDTETLFDSYSMQKSFGSTLYQYNFPSCFLIPFLLEPIFTIVVPYHLGTKLVGSKAVTRKEAELALAPLPMDLARYGDLIINLILATLALFLTSGYILWTFLGLLGGNLFIYAYAHYRILRHVQDFYYSSGNMDYVAQKLVSLPCALLAACVAYQLHGLELIRSSSFGGDLGLCIVAFCLHLAAHLLLLAYAQRLAHIDHPETVTSYARAAARYPGNWFTCNPVHCLRSRYLRKDEPACAYYVPGKEYLIEQNQDIGVYFCAPSTRTLSMSSHEGASKKA